MNSLAYIIRYWVIFIIICDVRLKVIPVSVISIVLHVSLLICYDIHGVASMVGGRSSWRGLCRDQWIQMRNTESNFISTVAIPTQAPSRLI